MNKVTIIMPLSKHLLYLVIGCMSIVPIGCMLISTQKQGLKVTLLQNSPALTYRVSTGELMGENRKK